MGERRAVAVSQNGQRVPFNVRCDWLTKMHQGTHSPDAFSNNSHELNHHVRCTDGTAIDAIVMSRIGVLGSFERLCAKGTRVASGIAPQAGQSGRRSLSLQWHASRSAARSYTLGNSMDLSQTGAYVLASRPIATPPMSLP